MLNQVIRVSPQEQLTVIGIRNGELTEWTVEVGQRPIYGSLTY